jgi:hypothetical protein
MGSLRDIKRQDLLETIGDYEMGPCIECRFLSPSDDYFDKCANILGWCCRHCPTITEKSTIRGERSHYIGVYPVVLRDYGCGEFRKRKK